MLCLLGIQCLLPLHAVPAVHTASVTLVHALLAAHTVSVTLVHALPAGDAVSGQLAHALPAVHTASVTLVHALLAGITVSISKSCAVVVAVCCARFAACGTNDSAATHDARDRGWLPLFAEMQSDVLSPCASLPHMCNHLVRFCLRNKS